MAFPAPAAPMDTCLSLTSAMGRARTLEDLYQAALDALAQGLGVVRSSILLFDPDGVMRFKASRGLSPYYQRAVEGHTPWRPDTPDPRPIVVSDAAREPSLQPYREIIAAEGIAAMAFIPLASDGRVIGTFMLYSDVHRAFTADELQLAGVIAAQVAFAVVRARSEAAAIERRPLLVSELIDSALTSVIPAAEAKRITLLRRMPRRPPFTHGDYKRLHQVLCNILSNAIKFTPEEGVVGISCDVDANWLTILVRDSGAGMAADFLPFVFERVRQADGQSARSLGGLGLGLAIARHLVELHGGQIGAQSEGPGRGSTFSVRLPLHVRPRVSRRRLEVPSGRRQGARRR